MYIVCFIVINIFLVNKTAITSGERGWNLERNLRKTARPFDHDIYFSRRETKHQGKSCGFYNDVGFATGYDDTVPFARN